MRGGLPRRRGHRRCGALPHSSVAQSLSSNHTTAAGHSGVLPVSAHCPPQLDRRRPLCLAQHQSAIGHSASPPEVAIIAGCCAAASPECCGPHHSGARGTRRQEGGAGRDAGRVLGLPHAGGCVERVTGERVAGNAAVGGGGERG